MAKETKPTVSKIEERFEIRRGDYVLIAKVEANNKGRLTLEKPDNVQNQNQGYGMKGGKRDYHFETSTPETVENFALCALEAVRLSREAYKADAQSEPKPKKGKN